MDFGDPQHKALVSVPDSRAKFSDQKVGIGQMIGYVAGIWIPGHPAPTSL